jgi:SOS-response transcriptional repressor LexA
VSASENNSLSKILNKLLFEKNIKPAELARLTKIPQPTIHRLVAGTSLRPHLASLKPIADFFSITIEQLIGKKPIPWLQRNNIPNIKILPLLNWNNIEAWNKGSITEQHRGDLEEVYSEVHVGNKAFGLTIKDASMEPVFSIGSIIIIDPEKPIRDRGFILVQLNGRPEPVLRQLIIDAGDYYIKAISPALESKMHKMADHDKIIGILVQSRRNFDA